MKNGLDDFRYGCPPCDNMITRGLPEHPQTYPKAPKNQLKLFKEATLFSKLSPAQLARKAFLEDIEAQLTPHPLARYPDLEKSVSPELLKKVLEVLDPEKKLEDKWAYCEGVKEKPKEPTKRLKKRPTQDPPVLSKKTPRPRLGQSLHEEKKAVEKKLLKEDGPDPYENVRKTVKDFCEWATSIGSSKIDEEYIMKQFEINYDSKSALGGVHAMRLDQVPLELKKGERLGKKQESEFFQETERKTQNRSKPKYVKMRYGAWYLNPKEWKRQPVDEPLVDPKVLRKAQDENARKEQKRQDEEFAKLRGPVAFKEFIQRKGYRMPSFLENINIKNDCNCDYNKTRRK